MLYHIMKPSENTLFKIVSKPVGEMREQPRRQEMIKSMMEKLQITSEGKAITFSVSTILKGNRPRTFSYSGTVGTGQSGMTSKWDLELRCERTSRKICVRGDISIPPFSIWNLNSILSEDPVFRFRNTLGYGRECESKVVINGYAKTSESQKHLARETPEAKEFERLRSKGTPMVELSKLAEIVRRQSAVLNVFDYKIKFVNVDDKVTKLTQRALEALEFVWMPHSVSKDSQSWWPVSSGGSRLPIESSIETVGSASSYGSGYGSENFEMEVRTTVHPSRGSYDVEITNVTRPEQKYKYRDAPMPYPFTYFYPVSYVTDPVSTGIKAVIGKPVFPMCTLEGKRIKLEGSNLLKNKLCGLRGDNNNNKLADVPSPRKCLLSTPELELASYRVSLPSKTCSPLPSHLKEELERESERCVKFFGKPTGGMSSSIAVLSGSESLSGSE